MTRICPAILLVCLALVGCHQRQEEEAARARVAERKARIEKGAHFEIEQRLSAYEMVKVLVIPRIHGAGAGSEYADTRCIIYTSTLPAAVEMKCEEE